MATQWSKKLTECKKHGNLIDCPSPDCNNEACEDCGACVKNCRKNALPKIKKFKKKVVEPEPEPVICSPELVSEEDIENDDSDEVSEDVSEEDIENEDTAHINIVPIDTTPTLTEQEKEQIEKENEEYMKQIQELKQKWKQNVIKLGKETKRKTKTKTKTKTTKFDIDATPVEDELSEILEDHLPPMKAWVGGNLKEKYCGIENKFKTLKEAHDYYLTTLKEKIDEDDVKYGGIMKCSSGYMLKPNKAKGEIFEYLPDWTPKQCPTHYKKWIFWNYENSGLKTKAERRAMRANK